MGIVDDLVRGREAFERREWAAAYDRLTLVDPAGLGPADLVALATAAYLAGDRDASVRAFQPAHQRHLAAGDLRAASRCASWLATILSLAGEMSVGRGWAARAERLLDSEPTEIVERDYVLVYEMFSRIYSGDFPGAQEIAVRFTEIGHHFGDADLIAKGLESQGRLLMYAGRVREGLALLDEAMVGIAAGEVSPIIAGLTYCSMIEACQEVSDLERASEWTSALSRWCDLQPGLITFTGQCAVHRGQIMRSRGAFSEALQEFEFAQRRYAESGWSPAAGLALCERGDVLRVRGAYDGAEAAYEQALELGHDPQPGLVALWLARGRTTAAVAALRRLLNEATTPVHRSRLLPVAVEILLAGDRLEDAGSAADELAATADRFGCTALLAMSGCASGQVQLAMGNPADALAPARRAWELWNKLEAPYEAARARMLLGCAFRALGDEESATGAVAAAWRTFDELGVEPRLREADRLLRRRAGGLTAREVAVLRLVAAGLTNPEIARKLTISDKTVARHPSNIFTKLDVRSRTAAAAFAFDHQLL